MVAMEIEPDLPWQAALVRDADISWISLNSSKPGRPATTSFVVHSTNAWADEHLDAPADDVRSHMLEQFSSVAGVDLARVCHVDLQRWRFANLPRQQGSACFVDADSNIAACGDWFIRGRVEAAFSSAIALLKTIDDQL